MNGDGEDVEAWKHAGLCRTPAAKGVDFFPGRGDPSRPAKDLCAQCPVEMQCLDYALVHVEKFGIWGGLSERQRRQARSAARTVRIAS